MQAHEKDSQAAGIGHRFTARSAEPVSPKRHWVPRMTWDPPSTIFLHTSRDLEERHEKKKKEAERGGRLGLITTASPLPSSAGRSGFARIVSSLHELHGELGFNTTLPLRRTKSAYLHHAHNSAGSVGPPRFVTIRQKVTFRGRVLLASYFSSIGTSFSTWAASRQYRRTGLVASKSLRLATLAPARHPSPSPSSIFCKVPSFTAATNYSNVKMVCFQAIAFYVSQPASTWHYDEKEYKR